MLYVLPQFFSLQFFRSVPVFCGFRRMVAYACVRVIRAVHVVVDPLNVSLIAASALASPAEPLTPASYIRPPAPICTLRRSDPSFRCR